MIIPTHCIDMIKKTLVQSGFIGEISPENPDSLAHHYLDEKRIKEQIHILEQHRKIVGRFLEIGSGFGGLVTYLNTNPSIDCLAFGIEPGADAYSGTIECARVLARANHVADRIVRAEGEAIPFRTNSFDIVYSTSVLEHVKDPIIVISEALRVLKPGGILQFVIPNYGSWWEGHYGILMLPHMPRFWLKAYVRSIGRNPEFVDTLQLITKGMLKKALAAHSDHIEILSWGDRLFEHRLRHLEFSEWASLGRLKRWISLIHKLKLIEAGTHVCRIFSWQTPIVLTLKKK